MPRLNRWIPHTPTPPQAAFLLLPQLEALYGGAAGGGKSEALLMAALQYVDVPGYAAILFRRTYSDLSLPGALMDRAHDWLGPTAAQWDDKTKTWRFPSGATLSFGYLEHLKQRYRYQSSEFHFIGWDELTQFPESAYTYLFSRLRRRRDIHVPLRVRCGSNPGGEGHAWVFERFIAGGKRPDRVFIPAKLADNPYIDQAEYVRSLAELDDVTRAQLLEGFWVTDPSKHPFRAEWWRGQNRYHADDFKVGRACVARWLSWDTGITDKADSAYTACVVVELTSEYRLLVREVWRDKLQFPDQPDLVLDMASRYNRDGKLRGVVIEDKATGTTIAQTLNRSAPEWLRGMLVTFQPRGDKMQRAQQAAVWAKRGCILLPHPGKHVPWLYDFESELFGFPDTVFKDQVDAFDQVVIYLENLISEGWHARESEKTE